MTVASTKINVDCVLVIDDSSDAGHWRVDRFLLLNESALFQALRQRTRIGQIRDVIDCEVATT